VLNGISQNGLTLNQLPEIV